jgi:hypothetical protein
MIGRHVASPSRALTIAITEQNRAMSFGSIQRYKEAGLQKWNGPYLIRVTFAQKMMGK